MKQFSLSQITSVADATQLAHHIVYDLHHPDYHPDDCFGITAMDQLVDEAFDVCGEDLYRIFLEECYAYLKQARIQMNS